MKAPIAFLIALIALIFASPVAASAAGEAAATAIIQAATPLILEAVGAGVLGVIGWAALVFKRKTGREIQKIHQDNLHRAILTGVRVAIEEYRGAKPLTTGEPIPKSILTMALNHAVKSVPDALKALAPANDVLTNIARAKARELIDGR